MTNDHELAEAIRDRAPEDLSAAELASLRERLPHSAELQQALFEQLQLETGLAGVLGQVELSAEEIIRLAGRSKSAGDPGRSWRWLFPFGVATALLVLAGIVYSGYREDFPRPEPGAAKPVAAVDDVKRDELRPIPSAQKNAVVNERDDPSRAAPGVATDTPSVPMPQQVPETVVAGNVPEPAAPQPAVVEETQPAEPWDEGLNPDQPARPFAQAGLEELRTAGHEEFPIEQARRWLAEVPGHGMGLNEEHPGNRRITRFNGLAKLRARWPADAVLRITPMDFEHLRLHVWTGGSGVSLRFYHARQPHTWAAFAATREGDSPQPARLSLLTTDSGRYHRANHGTFELRHQDGSLVLTRGDIRLLTVPLAAAPQEVILEGAARLRGMSMYRGEPAPAEPPDSHLPVLSSREPGELEWFAELPEGASVNEEAAFVELKAEKTSAQAWNATALETPGLYEVIVQVEEASPGTGVYLGDPEGKPLERIGFFREKRTGWTSFGYLRKNEERVESDYDPNAFAPPYAGSSQWLRIVAGLGTLKVWTSGDGVHWGRALEAPVRDANISTRFSTVGLFALKGEGSRAIRLKQIQVRELTGLTSLAGQDLRNRVPALEPSEQLDYAGWLHRTIQSCPDDVKIEDWLTAAAIRGLQEGAPRGLAIPLLEGLIAEGLNSKRSAEERLRLLDDGALLADLWGNAEAQRYAANYERLASSLDAGGRDESLRLAESALLSAPIWTSGDLNIHPPQLLQQVLLQETFNGNWTSVAEIGARVRFWNSPAQPGQRWRGPLAGLEPLFRWTSGMAAEHAAGPALPPELTLPRNWRHPLLPQLSKEGYNAMAELKSALAGEAFEDACRIITSMDATGWDGLLPDMQDENLLVSLPVAIATALRQSPELRSTLEEKFGPAGQVRVRQAISTADVRAARAATLQFPGTSAAAEALMWLGDRDLAAGRFMEAAHEYRKALRQTEGSYRAELLPRLQLAAVLQGTPPAESASAAVSLGEAAFTPDEFTKLIASLASPQQAATVSDAAPVPLVSTSFEVPPPGVYEPQPRGRFEGDAGARPGRGEFKSSDWAARQVAVALDVEQFYVSNRFQVTAFDAASAQVKWNQPLGGEQGEAHHWPFTPMVPLVLADKLLVRRITNKGVELVCLDKSNGQPKWRQRPETHVASDPVVWNGRLLALVALRNENGVLEVGLSEFDLETGAPTPLWQVLRLRDVWDGQPPCGLVLAGRDLIFIAGGNVGRIDPVEGTQWIRRFQQVPAEADPTRYDQYAPVPLVRDGRLYISQPGVRSLDCLDVESGQVVWSRPAPAIQRLIGFAEDKLIVQTSEGVEALDALSGAPLWSHEVGELLEAVLMGERQLLVARRLTVANNTGAPCLSWIDLATGRERSHAIVSGWDSPTPLLGPFVPVGGKLFAFAGREWNKADRELIELVRTTRRTPGAFRPDDLAHWLPEHDNRLQSDVSSILPGWSLLSPQPKESGAKPEMQGEQHVLVTRSTAQAPVRFVRALQVPAIGHPRLLARIGQQPSQSWKFSLHANASKLAEETMEDKTTVNGWKNLVIDLQAHAGRTVWLSVVQHSIDNKPADALWKQLEIVID